MKKLIAAILALVMLASLSACSLVPQKTPDSTNPVIDLHETAPQPQ